MKNFVHRPVARLARYELLLTQIMKETSPNHEDRETIPQTLEVLRSLLKETNTGVKSANERVEIWRYNQNLVFKPGEAIVCDVFSAQRRGLTAISRTWICLTKTGHLFTQASCCASLILASNGAVGRNCLYFSLTIIVRPLFIVKIRDHWIDYLFLQWS